MALLSKVQCHQQLVWQKSLKICIYFYNSLALGFTVLPWAFSFSVLWGTDHSKWWYGVYSACCLYAVFPLKIQNYVHHTFILLLWRVANTCGHWCAGRKHWQHIWSWHGKLVSKTKIKNFSQNSRSQKHPDGWYRTIQLKEENA